MMTPLEKLNVSIYNYDPEDIISMSVDEVDECLADLGIDPNPFIERELQFINETTKKWNKVNLSKCLQENFVEAIKAGWLKLEEIFDTPIPAVALRSDPIKQGKTIKLAKQIHLDQTVILVIELEEQDNQEIRILMRLHPTGTQTSVPENLKFKVIPEIGEPIEVIAGTHHDYLEQDWFYEKGEQFRVVVEFNEISVTENFVLPKE
jgi:hypothetical protein